METNILVNSYRHNTSHLIEDYYKVIKEYTTDISPNMYLIKFGSGRLAWVAESRISTDIEITESEFLVGSIK